MRMPGFVLHVALLFPTAGALVYFAATDPADPLFRITFAGSKVIQFALPVVALLIWDRPRLRAIRLSWRGLGAGLAVGAVFAAILVGGYAGFLRGSARFAAVRVTARAKMAGLGLDDPAGFLALAAVLSVAHAFLEEYYWRWFAHAELRDRLSRPWATAVSSLAFAAHHLVVLAVYTPNKFWQSAVPAAVAVAIGGAVWAWLYDRSRSIAGPWAAHALTDAALMAVGFDLLYR